MHCEQSPSNVGAETLNQRKERERCGQDRRGKKGLESGGRYKMGSLEDPCAPETQGSEIQWKDRPSKRGHKAPEGLTSSPPARFPGFPVLVSTFTTSHFLVWLGASE